MMSVQTVHIVIFFVAQVRLAREKDDNVHTDMKND